MRFSGKTLAENHARMLERNKAYRLEGHDPDKDIAFVLSKALPLEGRVLEIGTGKGRFLSALLRHVPRVTTVDVDAGEQRFARMNVAYEKPRGKARFVVADAARLPWNDASFDAVVSVNALHHMKDLPRVLAEILRVTRPGGRIVLADFNRAGLRTLDRIHCREGRVHPHEPYTFRGVADMLRRRGWNPALHKGACVNVLVASSRIKLVSRRRDVM